MEGTNDAGDVHSRKGEIEADRLQVQLFFGLADLAVDRRQQSAEGLEALAASGSRCWNR